MKTHFSKPHYVSLTLATHGCHADDLTHHESYYYRLKARNQVLLYGRTLNDTGLHILLYVDSDTHLAQIIENDPLLKSGCSQITGITPFSPQSLISYIPGCHSSNGFDQSHPMPYLNPHEKHSPRLHPHPDRLQ